MGLGGISIWQLLILLAIVMMVFGTKRLRSLGSDVGGAIKGFRSAMNEDKDKQAESDKVEDARPTDTQTRDSAAAETRKNP